MPLTIRIKKKKDGSAALSCVRADGSSTWQRQQGAQGRFFPIHDLTHYAVETELRFRRGFYGLLAEGWDITDFGAPWAKGPMPEETLHAELIVGFLDADRGSGVRSTAEELNQRGRMYATTHDIAPPPPLSDDALARIRGRLADLLQRWRSVLPGETLELPFDLARA
ncbi:MAG: hypothetical protein AB7R55_05500 [Gemmatimonadales bacterium]